MLYPPPLEPLEPRRLLAAVPSGFVDQSVTADLTDPTALTVAPDGRVFVAQQGGAIRVVKDGQLLPTPFAHLPVNTQGERGLVGIALDPEFATTGHVYVHYVTPGTENVHNRVSRLTATGDVAQAGSEQVLLDLPSIGNSAFHVGGAIHFGPDGKLYVAVGDHNVKDSPQSLTVPFGKILRINPDGSVPGDNPFVTQTTGVNRATYAIGLRNPYTMAFSRDTGQLLINDVGQDTWEEINRGRPGANYGWPNTEGPTREPGFDPPLHAYGQDQGCAITGGAFYTPATQAFPAGYRGRYFFADFCAGEIRVLNPASGNVFTFARGATFPTDLRVGDDGAIYYLSRVQGGGELRRIATTAPAGEPPTITAQPPKALTHVAGERAVLRVAVAAGQGPVSYQWQRDGQPIAGATSSTLVVPQVQTGDAGQYRVVVTAAGGASTSDATTLAVVAGSRPKAVIYAPRAGAEVAAGETVAFAGFVTDAESGHLGPKRFVWRVDLHHDNHVHPFVPATVGVTKGTFTIPPERHGDGTLFYRVRLSVTDPSGLTHSTFRDVRPVFGSATIAARAADVDLFDEQRLAVPPIEQLTAPRASRTPTGVT